MQNLLQIGNEQVLNVSKQDNGWNLFAVSVIWNLHNAETFNFSKSLLCEMEFCIELLKFTCARLMNSAFGTLKCYIILWIRCLAIRKTFWLSFSCFLMYFFFSIIFRVYHVIVCQRSKLCLSLVKSLLFSFEFDFIKLQFCIHYLHIETWQIWVDLIEKVGTHIFTHNSNL